MTFRWFEDFTAGEVIDLGSHTVTASEIVEFASAFDPAPFHLDEAAAKASMLGGLSASGWHTCSILMRMLCDTILLNSSSQGSPGVDECKWLAPVFCDDTLRARATVLDTRLLQSRPGLGIVRFRYDVAKDGGRPVLALTNPILFSTRLPAGETAA